MAGVRNRGVERGPRSVRGKARRQVCPFAPRSRRCELHRLGRREMCLVLSRHEQRSTDGLTRGQVFVMRSTPAPIANAKTRWE